MLTRVVGTAGCLSNTRASRRSFVHIVGLDARCSLEVWRRHVREVERLHERVSLADDRGVRGAGLTSRGDVLEPVAARDRHERHAAEVAAEVPQVALRVGQPLVGVLVLREQELRRLVEGDALDCGSVGGAHRVALCYAFPACVSNTPRFTTATRAPGRARRTSPVRVERAPGDGAHARGRRRRARCTRPSALRHRRSGRRSGSPLARRQRRAAPRTGPVATSVAPEDPALLQPRGVRVTSASRRRFASASRVAIRARSRARSSRAPSRRRRTMAKQEKTRDQGFRVVGLDPALYKAAADQPCSFDVSWAPSASSRRGRRSAGPTTRPRPPSGPSSCSSPRRAV